MRGYAGTGRALAVIVRSNTNTCPNYRVPLLPETHDDEQCDKGCADDPRSLARSQRAASVAQKRRTMYFGGYTSKKQPVGKHALAESSRTMNSLAGKIGADSAQLQFARVTTRMMSDLYCRGALRSLPEEFNLAVNMSKHDALSAEFWRTYNIQEFRGSAFLREEEKERHGSALQRPIGKILPPCSTSRF